MCSRAELAELSRAPERLYALPPAPAAVGAFRFVDLPSASPTAKPRAALSPDSQGNLVTAAGASWSSRSNPGPRYDHLVVLAAVARFRPARRPCVPPAAAAATEHGRSFGWTRAPLPDLEAVARSLAARRTCAPPTVTAEATAHPPQLF